MPVHLPETKRAGRPFNETSKRRDLMNSIRVVACFLGMLCAGRGMACDLCSVYSATEAQGKGGLGMYGGVAEQFTSSRGCRCEDQVHAGRFYAVRDGCRAKLDYSSKTVAPLKGHLLALGLLDCRPWKIS